MGDGGRGRTGPEIYYAGRDKSMSGGGTQMEATEGSVKPIQSKGW